MPQAVTAAQTAMLGCRVIDRNGGVVRRVLREWWSEICPYGTGWVARRVVVSLSVVRSIRSGGLGKAPGSALGFSFGVGEGCFDLERHHSVGAHPGDL